MDYKEFSGKIKSKYPQYADMDDYDLSQRMVKKYPQYSDVDFSGYQQPKQPAGATRDFEPVSSVWSKAGGTLPDVKKVGQYYAQGAKNLATKPTETLFPISRAMGQDNKLPLVGEVPGGKEIKGNVGALLDALSWLDRGADYLSGGAFTGGQETIAREAQKIPLKGKLGDVVKSVVGGAGAMIAPSTVVGGGTIKNVLKPANVKAQEKMLSQILAASKKPTQSSLAKVLTSEQGAVKLPDEIPDIDQLIKASESMVPESRPIINPKQFGKFSKSQAKDVKTGWLSSIAKPDADILRQPLQARDVPFTEYAKQAVKTANKYYDETGKPLISAMDMAGQRATQALDEVTKMRRAVGQKMDDALKPLQEAHYTQGILLDSNPIKQRWKELTGKYLGGTMEGGKAIPVEGRGITDPQELGLFKQLDSYVNNIGRGATIKELSDARTAVRRMTDNYKASYAQPINTTAEAAGKELNKFIDDAIMPYAGEEYQKLSRQYGNLKKIEDQLSNRLGQVVDEAIDPATGQKVRTARHGASLLKAAYASNADRGSKVMFGVVKDLTGIDLMKDAAYAKIAMDAVGDTRAADLLKTTAETVGLLKSMQKGGITGAVGKVAEKGLERVRGDKINELVRYYNSVQPQARSGQGLMDAVRAANKQLGQSGSIGGKVSGKVYTTDSPENWFRQFQMELADAPEAIPNNLYIVKTKTPSAGGYLAQGINSPDDVMVLKKVPIVEGEPDFGAADRIRSSLKQADPNSNYEFHLSVEPDLQEGVPFSRQARTISEAGVRGDMGIDQGSGFADAVKAANARLGQGGGVGSVDDLAALQSIREGFTPAIMDVESGKVFTGIGHKQILKQKIARESPNLESKIWNELFKDNTGVESKYIGFIDKSGNFISRADAERKLMGTTTLTQQFHDSYGSSALPMLGLTGAGAGAGLTLGKLLERMDERKKKNK